MARLSNYWFLLVLALVLGWMSWATSIAWAIVGVEIPDLEVAPVPPPVPTEESPAPYDCGITLCTCQGTANCNEMFKDVDCADAMCDESANRYQVNSKAKQNNGSGGDNETCWCTWPVEREG
jgi:hypothetical protein